MIRLFLGLGVIFLLSPSSGSRAAETAGVPIRLNLDRCVEIAIKNATTVLKTENNERLASAQLIQSYAQFLPTFDVGARYSGSSGKSLIAFTTLNIVDNANRSAGFTLYSTLNLFNGLSDFAGLKSAMASEKSLQQSLAWARQQVALDIIQTYLQLILDQKLVEIARKNLQTSQGRLEQLRTQTQVGSSSIADLYRQQAQTSSDTLYLQSTEVRAKDDETILIRKLRVAPDASYQFEEPSLEIVRSTVAAKPLDVLVREALANRSDLRATEFRTQFTDWDITRAKGDYYPHLDLRFTRDAAGQFLSRQIVNGQDVLPDSQQDLVSQLGNQVTYTLSLNLTWNLFDRLVTKTQVTRARLIHENAQIDDQDNRLQIDSDIRISIHDYETAWTQVGTARAGLEAAEKAFEAVRGRYQMGQATFIDVLSAQTALTQARSNQVQASVNLKLREKTLEYATGLLHLGGSLE